MKKSFILLVIVLATNGILKAQVKIGTNPTNINANALLELESTSKGLLFPRLTTAQINAMTNPPDGMMVYNTTIASFEIRTGGIWKSLSTENSAGWSLTGNAGINSDNFIGTTDNVSFRVRTNNLQRMIVDSTGKVVMGAEQTPAALLSLFNENDINSLYITNTSTNTTQFGVRSYVNGVADGSSRTAGEFLATGAGNNNTGIASSATSATVNYGGTFTASGGSGSTNIGVWGFANAPNGGTNYAVYGSIGSSSIGNDWAGYFLGRTYSRNRMILGLNENAENAQLTVRTPDTSYNAIFASTANTGGNGIVSTYVGSPTIYYAFWGIAPSTGQNAAGYFSGNVTITGTLTNPSDERLKQDIQPLASALDKVMKIGTRSYKFKSEYANMNLPQGRQFGYLAQDIEGIFPELVVNSADKSKGEKNIFYYKSVNYIGMIPVLTKALQEEHQQRLQTEQQMNVLKADNEALKKRLDAIEMSLSKLSVK